MAKNVLVILLDSLRQNHMGCYGYHKKTTPFIDKIASQGTLFETAITQGNWTAPAHMALFTGLNAFMHTADKKNFYLLPKYKTWAEMMKNAGYKTGAFTGGVIMAKDFGWERGFDVYNDEGRNLDIKTEQFLEWVKQHKNEKWFAFVHCFDIHYPFDPPEKYLSKKTLKNRYRKTAATDIPKLKEFASKGMFSKEDIEALKDLYDAGIKDADEKLKILFEELKKMNLLDNTIVIITSDNGEILFDRKEESKQLGHGLWYMFDEVVKVPIIIRCPGLIPAGKKIKPLVRHIDLLPTVLSLTEIKEKTKFHGKNLMPMIRGEKEFDLVGITEFQQHFKLMRSVRTNEWKYIKKYFEAKKVFSLKFIKNIFGYVKQFFNLSKEKKLTKTVTQDVKLFNLKQDPGELKNLAAEKPEKVAEFEKMINDLIKNNKLPDKEIQVEITDKTKEQMKGMGYL